MISKNVSSPMTHKLRTREEVLLGRSGKKNRSGEGSVEEEKKNDGQARQIKDEDIGY
jgi:hypothetical protein